MDQKILDYYLKFSLYTNPGCYEDYFRSLPDDVSEIGFLVRKQVIHRVTLRNGNTKSNADFKYGDMDKVQWWRLRTEDDVLPNAVSMIAELMRLDGRGFVKDRDTENKIIVTCRFATILTASILKSKDIPCRVRVGFSSYTTPGESWDHWINQYWDKENKRWVTMDVDNSLENIGFDPYDMPKEKFDWSAEAYLGIREGRLDENKFINAGGYKGLETVVWELFYDFHCLMNNEIIYLHMPNFVAGKFKGLTEKDFKEIDDLANLMVDPDGNFDRLKEIWETKKKFRILSGGLISDRDHVKYK